MYGCGLLIVQQTAPNSKSLKGHSTAAADGLQRGICCRAGVGPGDLPHPWRWRGWRVCGPLRLCLGHNSSVPYERDASLLFLKVICWLLRVRSKS